MELELSNGLFLRADCGIKSVPHWQLGEYVKLKKKNGVRFVPTGHFPSLRWFVREGSTGPATGPATGSISSPAEGAKRGYPYIPLVGHRDRSLNQLTESLRGHSEHRLRPLGWWPRKDRPKSGLFVAVGGSLKLSYMTDCIASMIEAGKDKKRWRPVRFHACLKQAIVSEFETAYLHAFAESEDQGEFESKVEVWVSDCIKGVRNFFSEVPTDDCRKKTKSFR